MDVLNRTSKALEIELDGRVVPDAEVASGATGELPDSPQALELGTADDRLVLRSFSREFEGGGLGEGGHNDVEGAVLGGQGGDNDVEGEVLGGQGGDNDVDGEVLGGQGGGNDVESEVLGGQGGDNGFEAGLLVNNDTGSPLSVRVTRSLPSDNAFELVGRFAGVEIEEDGEGLHLTLVSGD